MILISLLLYKKLFSSYITTDKVVTTPTATLIIDGFKSELKENGTL